MSRTAAVITISDKGARGERVDTSGPAVKELLEAAGFQVLHTAIVPDEAADIRAELIKCADELGLALVVTTGGTGFSPRDVTPEVTAEVLERTVPGIPEAMRAESMKVTARGCLSRGAAGIRGRTLLVNLPGSEKAARENLTAVLPAIGHGVDMLLSQGSADCGVPVGGKTPPSMDAWLREAKAAPDSDKVGMYLTHNGVVRATARTQVREGKSRRAVTGMRFGYDKEKAEAAAAEIRTWPGIFHVRIWLNEGELSVGDDLMYVLVGGDIRPHVIAALEALVAKLKKECVTEEEINSP